MKITCISDTHNYHKYIKINKCDILIHAGDFTSVGKIHEIMNFSDWLSKQPATYKIVIAGNHDLTFERAGPLAIEALKEKCPDVIYLQDNEVTIDGKRIYGAPWQPRFFDWAFNLDRGADIKRKWDLIPNGIDILITHGPPHGILDIVKDNPSRLIGCEELYKAVERVKPKYHIYGHVHDSYGLLSTEYTTFINASICTEEYKPLNKPIEVIL